MAWKFGRYRINVKCGNCGKDCVVNIKRGVTVSEAIKSKSIGCDNCGCEIQPTEYKTAWLK